MASGPVAAACYGGDGQAQVGSVPLAHGYAAIRWRSRFAAPLNEPPKLELRKLPTYQFTGLSTLRPGKVV